MYMYARILKTQKIQGGGPRNNFGIILEDYSPFYGNLEFLYLLNNSIFGISDISVFSSAFINHSVAYVPILSFFFLIHMSFPSWIPGLL